MVAINAQTLAAEACRWHSCYQSLSKDAWACRNAFDIPRSELLSHVMQFTSSLKALLKGMELGNQSVRVRIQDKMWAMSTKRQ